MFFFEKINLLFEFSYVVVLAVLSFKMFANISLILPQQVFIFLGCRSYWFGNASLDPARILFSIFWIFWGHHRIILLPQRFLAWTTLLYFLKFIMHVDEDFYLLWYVFNYCQARIIIPLKWWFLCFIINLIK